MGVPTRVYVGCSLALVGVLIGLASANPGLTAIAVAGLCAILLIGWRPGEPPALVLVGTLHWVSASAALLRADIDGREVWRYSEARSIDQATALSLLAPVVLVAFARIVLGRGPVLTADVRSLRVKSNKLLALWIASSIAAIILWKGSYGGVTQIMRSAAELKWIVVLTLFIVLIRRPSGWLPVATVACVETGLGFLSFFANFRAPIYVLALALLSERRRLTLGRLAGAAVVVSGALLLGVVWTSVKGDYRDYINDGSGNQVVVVSAEQQADKLVDLVDSLDGDRLAHGATRLVDRVSYVEFFALAMDFVPRVRPHEDGRRLLGALQHVLEPRLLFPRKPALDDTADTERYTGLRLRSGRQTSISLGYPAEAYIDAGPVFMFVEIALFGLMFGGLAGVLRRRPVHPIVAHAAATVFLMTAAGSIEMSFAKMLGAALTAFPVFWFGLWIFARWVEPWLFAGGGRQDLDAGAPSIAR